VAVDIRIYTAAIKKAPCRELLPPPRRIKHLESVSELGLLPKFNGDFLVEENIMMKFT